MWPTAEKISTFLQSLAGDSSGRTLPQMVYRGLALAALAGATLCQWARQVVAEREVKGHEAEGARI
jgi:hypothetical protein